MADEDEIALLETAARHGARSVTRWAQVIDDAAQETVERWESKILRGIPPTRVDAWAFRVGRNAAIRLFARVDRTIPNPDLHEPVARDESRDEPLPHRLRDTLRASLRRHLASLEHTLRGRQLEVIETLLEDGMNYRQAAKALGMSRFNVKRSFRSALRRLSGTRK